MFAMKKLSLILFFLIVFYYCDAQQAVGIGSTTIHPSAVVDISKTNKGVLIPRLTQSARLVLNQPAEGLLVYDSTAKRLFQFQNGQWVFFMPNNYWVKTNANFLYSLDSVGIGTASPNDKLDVNGNIRVRSSLRVNSALNAANSLQAGNLNTTGTIAIAGSVLAGNDIYSGGAVSLDNPTGIVQFKNAGTNTGFLQIAGDDLRLGTNSGNTSGKTIIRMNGTDIISVDTSASLRVLVNGSGGNLSMGQKLSRVIASDDNMLAIASGRINADGTIRFMTQDGTCTRVSTGVYDIVFYAGRFSARSAIVASAGGSAPRLCSGTFMQNGYFLRFRTYDPISGALADSEFSFIIHDPQNIF